MPGNGPNNCNARCSKLENNLCTAKTDPTFDLGAEKLGSTICSSNATVNPAYHDFANSKFFMISFEIGSMYNALI